MYILSSKPCNVYPYETPHYAHNVNSIVIVRHTCPSVRLNLIPLLQKLPNPSASPKTCIHYVLRQLMRTVQWRVETVCLRVITLDDAKLWIVRDVLDILVVCCSAVGSVLDLVGK
jgi:hypothetical protein